MLVVLVVLVGCTSCVGSTSCAGSTGCTGFTGCVLYTRHNSGAALFTYGAVAINLHFQTLVELKGGAHVVVLYGEPDVGITNAAMSVLGIEACIEVFDVVFYFLDIVRVIVHLPQWVIQARP